MNIDHLLNLKATVTDVVMDGPEDQYGNPTESASTRTIKCWLHQTEASEDSLPSGVDSEDYTLYTHATADISAADRIQVLGVSYEVSGEPWRAIDPRTAEVVFQKCHVRRADR